MRGMFSYRPMLATAARDLPSGDWVGEVKWDGVRAAAIIGGSELTLISRNGNDITAAYPELTGLGAALPEGVLDGEIVASDDQGRPSFERLQQRMHVRDRDAVRRLAETIPVAYLAFDLLELSGADQMPQPWTERRARLVDLGVNGSHWNTPAVAETDAIPALFALTREQGLEGVVVKRPSSQYEPGRRSTSWRKVKHFTSREFVVGGYEFGTRGRQGTIGALLLGAYDGADLVYCGEVGTGFTQEMLAVLFDSLRRIERSTSPFARGPVPKSARFVEPVIVVEVQFAQWTEAGVLRAPSFRGVRTDIDPADVARSD